MERLLSNSSPTSTKFHLKFSPFLPRSGLIDSSKLNFPSSIRPDSRRLTLISCQYHNPPPYLYPSSSSLSNNLPSLPNGPVPKSHFAEHIEIKDSAKRKVNNPIFVDKENPLGDVLELAGTLVLLSSLLTILIQPIFAPAAFATFQAVAKSGGPAASAVGQQLLSGELLSSAWTGFFAGCLHTLSGPDHLAALAPLSIGRTRVESAIVGALWGCGHDAGQVIFGLLFLLLKDRLHIEIFRTWGTRVVGITLLVIGAMGIREASEVPTPCVGMENGECDVDIYETLERSIDGKKKKKKKIGFATFATGIVHGLQPDALMMVLPALALPSRLAGAAFLVMFLVGTVISMGSYTVFIGSCSEALKDRVPRITEKLTWASSIVAIALGFAILASQLFGYSLY